MHLPPTQAEALLVRGAGRVHVDGFQTAAAVGAVVLFATAIAAWFLLRGQKLADGVEH